jgi:phosphatidate cytidylyltransferase
MRNISLSILTGVVLGIVVLASIIIHPYCFSLVLLVGVIVATWELTITMHHNQIRVPFMMLCITSILMFISVNIGHLTLLILTYIITCGAVFAYSSLEKHVLDRHSSYTSGIFIITYLPLCLSFFIMIELMYQGPQKLILTILAVVASDTGGLLFGIQFGKHKMAPRISPKKTWEGFIGGTILSILVCTVFAYFNFTYLFFGLNWIYIILFAILATCVGTFGDLAESIIKRDAGIKDIGGILPGHGGVMDRLDSLIFFAPIAYCFLTLVM